VIDLHCHSTISDGTDAPGAVVHMAADIGLHALALSDHDTLEHLPAASAAANEVGVRLIPACEISCSVGGRVPGSMHLLVYWLGEDGVTHAPESPLGHELGALQQARNDRNVEILAALRTHGIDITADELREEAGPGVVGRPHIAAILVRRGAVNSIQGAFDAWLGPGKPAYFERDRLTPEAAIALARASGAVTSVAHPYTLGLEGTSLDPFVAELAAAGLTALECEYGAYSPERRAELRARAARHGLAATGGSDYHGTHKPGIKLGVGTGDLAVPDALLDELAAHA
jgi:predicted metal-dependent phosphoesterase TrpH